MITGSNEVVAQVMFLQVCVCPQGGRVSASVHAGMPDQPPGPGRPPWTMQTPLNQADTPQTRQTPPDQADPPRPGRPPQDQADTPPGPGRPPGKQTPAYGLRVAGTHPTGMHSYFTEFLVVALSEVSAKILCI